MVTLAHTAVSVALKVVPVRVTVAPDGAMVPLFTVPAVKTDVPLIVKVFNPKSIEPDVIVKFFTEVFAGKTGVFAELTITTLSIEEGIPLGVQLEAVFQLEEAAEADQE